MERFDDLIRVLDGRRTLTDRFINVLPAKLIGLHCDEHTVIAEENRPLDFAWWLAEGYAQAYYYTLDELGLPIKHTVDFWKGGSFIVMSGPFFNGEVSRYGIAVARGSRLIGISRSAFEELEAETGEAYELAVAVIADHYDEKLDRMALLRQTALQRYLAFLDFYHPNIEQYFYLEDIASFLGMRAETLSRLRG